jgi:hypothetical protein
LSVEQPWGYGVLAVAVADLMRHIGAAYDIGVNKG